MEAMNGLLYKASNWVMRFAYVNLLWVLFTLVGLVLFGFFPATVALFTIIRKWIIGQQNEVLIFNTFWKIYRKEFLKSNLIGLIIIFVGYILYVDFLFLSTLTGPFANVMSLLFITTLLLYGITVLYIFPVYVHYEIKLMHCFKYAFIIGFSYPLITLLMILSFIIDYFITALYPAILPFFSISVLAFCLMRFSHLAFHKVAEKNSSKKI